MSWVPGRQLPCSDIFPSVDCDMVRGENSSVNATAHAGTFPPIKQEVDVKGKAQLWCRSRRGEGLNRGRARGKEKEILAYQFFGRDCIST